MLRSLASLFKKKPLEEKKPISESKPTTVTMTELEEAVKSASSNIAKHVFDPNNRQHFEKLFTTQPLTQIVADLNKINATPEQFEQFRIFTSNQKEYAALFDLPPKQWMAILLQEKILQNDLAALVASSDSLDGAFSGMLEFINSLPDPYTRAKLLFYLNHAKDESDNEIKAFLAKMPISQDAIASMYSLHHILHNVLEGYTDDGITMSTRAATENILRIKPHPQDDEETKLNKARLKAALRIMKECMEHAYEKTFQSLSEGNRKKLIKENNEFLAKQAKNAPTKARDRQRHGELSLRTPQHLRRPLPIEDDLLGPLLFLNMLNQQLTEAESAANQSRNERKNTPPPSPALQNDPSRMTGQHLSLLFRTPATPAAESITSGTDPRLNYQLVRVTFRRPPTTVAEAKRSATFSPRTRQREALRFLMGNPMAFAPAHDDPSVATFNDEEDEDLQRAIGLSLRER